MSIYFRKFGNQQKPALLFLHGFMGQYQDWEEFINPLLNDFHIYLIDLPGHGRSHIIEEKDEFFIQLQNFLKQESSWFIYSYSMGARVFLEYFFTYLKGDENSHGIKKIIIESANPGIENKEEKRKRLTLDQELLGPAKDLASFETFLHSWYGLKIFGKLKNHKSYSAMIKRRLTQNPCNLQKMAELFSPGLQENFRPFIENSKIPILYLAGENDKKYSSIALSLSNIKFDIIPSTSHNIHMERPSDIIKIIKIFFN